MVKHEIRKLTHYEFWPFWLFYIPMIPVWLWYSLKAGSLTYFTAANPGMKFGGFFNYSKYKIQQQLAPEHRPEHRFLQANERDTAQLPFEFPFIAKPDAGERGKKVQLVTNEREWSRYLNNNPVDLIFQEFIDLPQEFGVFYARMPHESKGRILSVTGKNFLTFRGDGVTSLREFIESDPRAYYNKSYLYMKFHTQQELVLEEGESMLLEEIGNHNRGTYFYDLSDLITPAFEDAVDRMVKPVDGFFYGRLDVKTTDENALQRGDFQILEINGSNSEATHIFDLDLNIFDAYREVLRHLKVQYEISAANIKNGFKPAKTGQFASELCDYLFS